MSKLDNNCSNNFNNNILYMVPKMEKHIEYVLAVVLKLPRIEKFNIGQEMKCIAYEETCNILRNVVIGEYIYILGIAKYVINNTMGIIENIMDGEILVIVSDVYF